MIVDDNDEVRSLTISFIRNLATSLSVPTSRSFECIFQRRPDVAILRLNYGIDAIKNFRAFDGDSSLRCTPKSSARISISQWLLGLVKSASRLQEEQRHFDEVVLEFSGLAFTPGSLVEVREARLLVWNLRICCGYAAAET